MTTESSGSAGGANDLDLFEESLTGQTANTEKVKTIPAKYEGKTVEDLIDMHQNAERLNSRQGAEVGQLRRMTDELLNLRKTTTQVTEERKPVTVDALLHDPEKAISDAVANSPLARRAEAAEQRSAILEQRILETEFSGKHKTVQNDINDPAFLEWVNKNPLRVALAASAAKEGDANRYVAANNLWDLWDEHKELIGGKTAATLGKGKTVPNTVKSAPAESRGKPTWSRAKLMELRIKVQQGDQAAIARFKDPAFEARMNEAYAEGRVK